MEPDGSQLQMRNDMQNKLGLQVVDGSIHASTIAETTS
jgi:hypothetical protein